MALHTAVEIYRLRGREGANDFAAEVKKQKSAGDCSVSDDLFSDLELTFRSAMARLLQTKPAEVEALIQLSIGYDLFLEYLTKHT